MTIEEALNVDEFPSLAQKLNVNLEYTYTWASDQLQEFYHKFGLTAQQYHVLKILKSRYPRGYTTSEILNGMKEKNSGVSRLVDRLVKKDLVRKEAHKVDKRLVDIVISKKAIDILNEMQINRFKMDEVFENLTYDEMNELSLLLDKLRG